MKQISANLLDNLTPQTIIDSHRAIDVNGVRAILSRLKLEERLLKARKIIIKPNFAGGSVVAPETHAVTDPVFLRQLAEIIHELNPNASVAIAESDSAGPGFAYLKFEHQGLTQWKLPWLKLLDLSRTELCKIDNGKFLYFGVGSNAKLFLSKQLMEADFMISTANLKTHSVTKFTGCCKNLFGLLPRTEKYFYHTGISEVIHDLYLAKTTDLSIVDAFFGMEGNGPIGGKPIDLGFRLWGSDAAEVDAIGAEMIKIPATSIKHLALILPKDRLRQLKKLELPKFSIQFRGKMLAFFNCAGLMVQRIGEKILMYGHKSHTAYSIPLWIYLTIRPLILKFISLDKLKEIRKKWRH